MKAKLFLKDGVVVCSLRKYSKRYGAFSLLKLIWRGAMAINSPKPGEYIDIAILIK